MKSLTRYIPRWWVLVIGAILLYGAYAMFARPTTYGFESEEVRRSDVVSIVSGTGVVEAPDTVALAFEVSGTVAEVYVSEGERVSRGDPLVRLDASAREADLAGARARVLAEEARLAELNAGVVVFDREAAEAAVVTAERAYQNAQDALRDAERREDIVVANAYEKLLTDGLAAIYDGDAREESIFNTVAPTITGTYSGGPGEYRIALYRSGADSGYSYRLSGLEEGTAGVLTSHPQLLGTRGLYIQFPDNFIRTTGTTWSVEIPNTRAGAYVANQQAYDRAVELRVLALNDAERSAETARVALDRARADRALRVADSREERIVAQEAVIAQAVASLRSVEIAYEKQTLYAPFDGVVHTLPAQRGGIASPGTPALTLLSDAAFEVALNVTEADIAELSVGNQATISFDAYPDSEFPAEVVSIAPAAQVVNGVSTFKTRLYFLEPDARIRAGFSADVDIAATRRDDVISIPGRAVIRSEGVTVVRVYDGDRIVERQVETGLRGVDGRVEIISGLSEGDRVVTFIEPEELSLLLEP